MNKIFKMFVFAITFSVSIIFADEVCWRKYEVYQPTIKRTRIITAKVDRLPYNHCTNIAWFGDRWFCLWNGNNNIPKEGKSGQLIYFSTSFDGKNWSEPRVLFSNSELCEDPVKCTEGWQWQPALGVIDNQLWCFWWQDGCKEDTRGSYFCRLDEPDGKWKAERILWDGSWKPVINGKKFRVFHTQGFYQLRSGRVLAPASIMAQRAEDAPEEVTNWYCYEKYNTVLYTDDKGKTWHISPGASLPDQSWGNWEPTVWEVENGDVLMVARHNVHMDMCHYKVEPSKYLLSSVSHDGGETWEPHKYVPLETICSRPHVVALDGKGTWTPAKPEDDFTSRLYIMAHSDVAGGYNWHNERKNIALYFNRGAGFTFTPGTSVTGIQPRVCYPAMWVHKGKMLVSYTQSYGDLRSPWVASISPLPDPDKHYLLPRNNTMEPVYPVLKSNSFHFEGMQYLESREIIDPGNKGFSAGIWAKLNAPGTFFDFRANKSDCGFTLATHLNADKKTQIRVDFDRDLALEQKWLYGEWQYIGLTYDKNRKTATFYINGKNKKYSNIIWPDTKSLKGTTMYVGFNRTMEQVLWDEGFVGDIRAMAMYAGHVMDADAHRWLYNKYAESLGQKALSKKGNRPDAEPILWLDGADKKSLRKYFKPEPENTDGVKVVKHSGKKCLKINGEGSAGVDIDENYRSKGDIVEMKLRYKPLTDNAVVLCTAGDADHPGRVLLRDGKSILTAGSQELGCGEVSINGWNDIYLKTAENYTWVQVNDNAPAIVYHRPQGTWLFLGEGYPRDILSPNSSLLIDVDSVTTKVMRK
jgi:hypothetical protein